MVMFFLSIVHHYLLWHYSRAFLEIWHVWRNFMWFTIHFFSLPDLVRNWFAPFKRIVEDRGDTWSLEDLAGFIIIGIITRIIGALLRTIFILLGLITLLVIVLGGFATYLFWVAAPAIVFALLAAGIALIIT